jgi:PGF-pre-PGF domain-containing protein
VFYWVWVCEDPSFDFNTYDDYGSGGWILDDNWQVSLELPGPAGKVYFWCVMARDNVGNESENSPIENFVIDPEAPPQVTLYSPENNDSRPLGAVTFEWYAVTDTGSGVNRYEFQIDNEPSFTEPYVHENTSIPAEDNTYSYTFGNVGAYYWRVRAIDNVGHEGAWAENFRIDVVPPVVPPPESPVLYSPENTSIFSVGTTVIFEWENGANAENHRLEIDNDMDWTNGVYENIPDILDNTYSYTFNVSGTYRWRVWAVNESGENVSENTWRVGIARWTSVETWIGILKTATPYLKSPSNGTITDNSTVTFEWENTCPVDNFRIQIDNEPSFSSPLIDNAELTDNTYTATLGDNLWYWRVNATYLGSTTDWSDNWTVRVDTTPPPQVTLTSPANGATLTSTSVNFSWQGVSDPSGVTYTINVDGVDKATGLTATSYSDTLSEGSHSWKVTAVDGAGNVGTWSSTWSFTIEIEKKVAPPPTPTLIPPTSFIELLALYWQASLPFEITAQASDEDGTVVSVALYYRYRIAENWSDWKWFGTDNEAPWRWDFTAPENDAYYEFYSLAIDDDGEIEVAPTVADMGCGVDLTAPWKPILISPLDLHTTSDATPTFDWSDVEDLSGATYVLTIDNDADFSSPILQKIGLENSRYVLPDHEALTEGTYFWRVQVIDKAGNTGGLSDAWSLIFRIEVPTRSIHRVPAGESVPVDFTEENLFVMKVSITVENDVQIGQIRVVEIEVEEFVGRPEYAAIPPGVVYGYFGNITTDIPTKDIGLIKVEFRVPRSWVERENIDENTIRLLRWVGNEWENLETKFLENDADYLYFESRAEGFSLFAVIGQKRAPVSLPAIPPEVILPPTAPPIGIMALLLIVGAISISTFVTFQIVRWTKRRALKPAPVTLARPKIKKVKPKKPPPVIEIYRDILAPAAEKLAKKKAEEEARKRKEKGTKRESGRSV